MKRRALARGAGALAALSLTACQPRRPPREPPRPVLWPPPPESPRYRLEATLRRASDVEGDVSDTLLGSLAGSGGDSAGFSKPYGVAAFGGFVYVTDTVERLVHVFNLPDRRYFRMGYRREGALAKPLGISVDRRGEVYVVDASARRVVVYDRLGLWQRFVGEDDALVRPTAVAASPGGERVYVVDTGGVESDTHRVLAYDADGRLLFQRGRRGAGAGEFNLPTAAAVGADGRLHVLDAGNFRVQSFDPDGRPLGQVGELGSRPGQLARPRGVAVDDEGLLYVSDAAFGNVQVFRPDGRLMLVIGATGAVDEPGRYALPAGVWVDETQRLYLLDQLFLKLDVIGRFQG